MTQYFDRGSTARWLVVLAMSLSGCAAVPARRITGKPNPEDLKAIHAGTSLPAINDSRVEADAAGTAWQSRRSVASTKSAAETPRKAAEPGSRESSDTVVHVSSETSATSAAASQVAPAVAVQVAATEEIAEVHNDDVAAVAYPMSLGNVLYLADSQNPNIAAARERINEAYARVERAETMWLPSVRGGLNYNHHEGAIQDVAGKVFNTTRSSFYGGAGANAVGAASPAVPGLIAQFHLTDAIFQPRIAEHQAAARQFGATAARNDTLRDAAVAYLELVRAEHALAIAREAQSNTRKLTELTRQYATTGQGLQSDYQRLEAELALRQEELVTRQEGVQVASARLAQILHADPATIISSGEPAIVPLQIMTLDGTAASYVATGLSRRPELAEQQHLVCEAVERLRREKYAPLIPSVLLGMSYGGMGGGLGTAIVNTNDRWDADAGAYWEVRNLGFGERAARSETASQQRQAQMRQLAILDRVAREVAEAHAQVTQRQQRVDVAKKGVVAAHSSYSLNLQRIENAQGLPIEVLQSIQALATAEKAYLNAVIDYNVAQFELCRATGWFLDE